MLDTITQRRSRFIAPRVVEVAPARAGEGLERSRFLVADREDERARDFVTRPSLSATCQMPASRRASTAAE